MSRLALLASRVLTMVPAAPPCQVVIVDNGRIVTTGDRHLLEQYPGIDHIDVGDRTVVPGLIDAHNHLSVAALQPLWADATDVTELDVLGRRVDAARPRTDDPGGWLRAHGWDDHRLPLSRRELDDIEPDRPLLVAHWGLHECVVNSRGLDALGISARTPDPLGGTIGRDLHGTPDGRLVERAWSTAHRVSMRAYEEPDRWGELIANRCHTLLSEGITAVHDAACSLAAEAVYSDLARMGELPISVLTNPHPAELLSPVDAARLEGPPTGEGSEMLRVGPIKLFADGGSHPSINGSMHGHPIRSGFSFEMLEPQIQAAAKRGFGISTHVIGNAEMDTVLDNYTTIADRGLLLRIEHATLASDEQLDRIASLGVHAVIQPGFVPLVGPLVEGIEIDGYTWMPFRGLLDRGVSVAGSSDDPCDQSSWRPLRAMEAGVSRLLPSGNHLGADQSVDPLRWLEAYTRGAALAGQQAGERGELVPGARADLTILEGSLADAASLRVAETWVGGQRVYQRSHD